MRRVFVLMRQGICPACEAVAAFGSARVPASPSAPSHRAARHRLTAASWSAADPVCLRRHYHALSERRSCTARALRTEVAATLRTVSPGHMRSPSGVPGARRPGCCAVLRPGSRPTARPWAAFHDLVSPNCTWMLTRCRSEHCAACEAPPATSLAATQRTRHPGTRASFRPGEAVPAAAGVAHVSEGFPPVPHLRPAPPARHQIGRGTPQPRLDLRPGPRCQFIFSPVVHARINTLRPDVAVAFRKKDPGCTLLGRLQASGPCAGRMSASLERRRRGCCAASASSHTSEVDGPRRASRCRAAPGFTRAPGGRLRSSSPETTAKQI